MKQIGQYRDEEGVLLNYYNVPQDKNGWVDALKFHPADYDLVDLEIQNKPFISGWISYGKWVGLRLRLGDKVLRWRHQK